MFKSNIPTIVRRMERLQAAQPLIAQRAISPAYWRERLEISAEKTLRQLWVTERNVELHALFERMTPQIVKTLTAELLDGPVARYTIGVPAPASGGPAAAGDIGQARSEHRELEEATHRPGPSLRLPAEQMKERSENIDLVRAGILEWVKYGKRKETDRGGRDYGVSNEQIAERLEWIFGLRPGQEFAKEAYTGGMQAAADRLAGPIQAFLNADALGGVTRLDRGTKQTALPAQTVWQWLEAITAAWRALVAAGLPGRWKHEWEKEVARIHSSML